MPDELAPITQGAGLNAFSDKESFNQLARESAVLAKTSIIPEAYRNKPEDCMVAIDMANRIGVSPMMVMQNLYVVKGKPSWSGQACMSLIQGCGKFHDVRPVYTGTKGTEDRACHVEAVRISDGEKIEGAEVSIRMAKAEGWISNPKWRNMPELMLAYRASAFFARVYCPERLMGVYVEGEADDIQPGKRTVADPLAPDKPDTAGKDGIL